ncbi:MAG: TonB family protein [Treponema sp.]|uniref:energy transducer TonB n=1 Tax=Treponema sp. TaxID=166 RepID=UPI0036090326
MTRWISSALCTMTLVGVLFCLPVWNIRSVAAPSNVSNTAMSEVHIVKRLSKKAPPVVQKTVQPKKVPTIPASSAEPVPVPEPAEVPNEPAEIPTEETPDDTSASDIGESESNNTAAVTGAEDSFSHTQDAKAVATYKSYALGRIASKKTYPYTARSNGFEGRVRVRIVINPDGTLAQTDILEPSEYEILNKACLTAIKKASPFKKMESGMSAMTLSFVMDFSLN